MTTPQNISDNSLQGRSLKELHQDLKNLQENNDSSPEDIQAIKAAIRQSIPAVDTGGSLPQKKTPSGQTNTLHMNYARNQAGEISETEIKYLQFFADTATELEIKLEIVTDQNSRPDLDAELKQDKYQTLDYAITESPNPVSKWAEDSMEYLANGTVAVLQSFDPELLEWAMVEGRKSRWSGIITDEYLAEAIQDDDSWIPLGVRVNALNTSEDLTHVAKTRDQQIGHIRTYIEGGNMITGEDQSGRTILLVGQDSISATANIYQLDHDGVRQLICEDFGLEDINQVVTVEQPGKFHLDMGLLFLGKGLVFLNDSSEAFKDAVEMAEMVPSMTINTMAAKATLQYNLENQAEKDLTNAGLKVIRKKLENDVFHNFFNGEFITGKDGTIYYITNGGEVDMQDQLQALIKEEYPTVDSVVFSPIDIARKSLQEKGGVGCRLKGSKSQKT